MASSQGHKFVCDSIKWVFCRGVFVSQLKALPELRVSVFITKIVEIRGGDDFKSVFLISMLI